jgi:hypothetical protein
VRHPNLHDIFLVLFLGGYMVSAVFVCWEYQRLGISKSFLPLLETLPFLTMASRKPRVPCPSVLFLDKTGFYTHRTRHGYCLWRHHVPW